MDIQRYYDIYWKMNDLMDKLVAYTNGGETINIGYGNYDSYLVLILVGPEQNETLKVYQKALNSIGMGIDNIFVTYFNKTSIQDLNISALKKEFEILGNKPVFVIHDINIKLNDYNIKCIDSKKVLRLSELEDLNSKKDYILTESEKNELNVLGMEIWNNIGPCIYYAKQYI